MLRGSKNQGLKKNLPYWYWLAGIFTFTLLLLIVLMERRYHEMMNRQAFGKIAEDISEYKYHCVFITEDQNDSFFNSIYEGAKEEGRTYGIYVEKFGERLLLKYSVGEAMKMAIASGVDAIIIEGEKSTEMTGLIGEAVDQGIAVITVHTDNAGSRRQSFIGVNNFQMGYSICSKAVGYLDMEEGKILVLYDKNSSKYQDYIILNAGIQKYLDETGSKYTLGTQFISSTEIYDTQAEIRSLLRNEADRPKMLICTNMIQTQCAYQTVVDLNCVGEVKIIGFYDTQTIREAMERDVIQATMMIDTRQMGKEAVKCISEYFIHGYASDYVSVSVTMMDKNDLPGEEEAGQAEQ